jgi:HD-like signal output (HDOD) protein
MSTDVSFQIPALPKVAREALVHLYKADPEVAILVRILSSDPGLSSDIFRLANSAFLGGTNPTSDLKTAIGRVGLTTLRQLVMLNAMASSYKLDFGGIISVNEFWKHGAYVGQVAYTIAKKLKHPFADELQITGLLHDIGIVFMHFNEPETISTLTRYCKTHATDLSAAEKALGTSKHSSLGALVLEQWKLSERLQLYISLHDSPEAQMAKLSPEDQSALKILKLSDTLAHRNQFGFKDYTRSTAIDVGELESLGLAAQDLRQISTQCSEFLKLFI